MKTVMTPKFERAIQEVDAKGQVLGKLAVDVANKLRGKDKVYFVDHLDVGDSVVVIDAHKITLTGNKINQKLYRRHSGFIGSLKETPVKVLMATKPEEVIRRAVEGMLPKNKLRKGWIKRLSFRKETD